MKNVSLNKILHQNEKEANIQTARVMVITFLIFTVVYILELLGIFIVKKDIMTISYIISSFILLLPTVINKCIGPSAKGLKYLYVLLSGLFMFVITTTLTFHVVIVYAYPIAIAGMYFSKKLTQIATVMTIIVTICGQFCGFYMDFCHDNNFENLYKLVVYGILPRLLTLISFSALLNTLSQRTSKLLEEDIKNYEKLVMYNSEMVYSFATLIENRDENTGGHIKRTSIYVGLLAEELKKENFYCDIITDDFIKNLVMVAPLHDIGKISTR